MKTIKSTSLQTTGSRTPFRRLGVLGTSLLFLIASVPTGAATLSGLLEIAGQKANPTMGRGHKGRGHMDKASIKDVAVTLYEATEFAPIALATTSTDDNGSFALDIARDTSNSIFFLRADVAPDVVFIAILGVYLPEEAIINEVTTVASSYAMAQFYRTGQIAGDGLRLQIASMMYTNIVDPQTGEISEVLKTSPNAGETTSLRLTRSLANLVNGCATKSSTARVLLTATRDEAGRFPDDCAEALANLARAPAQAVDKVYRLSTTTEEFKPALTGAPDQWTIAIKVNDTGSDEQMFGGPANVDWDSFGYAWISNNVVQGTPNSTKYNVVLRPDGRPADGSGGEPVSPFNTGGLLGVGWGVSVDADDNIWFGNYGWGKPKDTTYPSQTMQDPTGAGTGSVSRFLADGTAVTNSGYYGPYRVQAIEPGPNGDIWIASFGDRDRRGGSGVWVFKNGDPDDFTFSLVEWEDAPFGIAPTPDGRSAWVTFSGGLGGENQSSIAKYELGDDGEVKPLFIEAVGDTLKVVALDYAGNAWFASQGTDSVFAFDSRGRKLGEFTGGGIDGPWGIAVDGEGNIWVSNFGATMLANDFNEGRLSKLCGANPAAWPKGLTMGDPISPQTGYTVPSAGEQVRLANGDPLYGHGAPPSFSPMMRQTSVQIDRAGNVWSINNWKPRFDIDATENPGGDGIIIFVGLAPPPP